MLKVVANHSPKNFYELKMFNHKKSKLLPEELESFLINWGKRLSRRPLVLSISMVKNIDRNNFDLYDENIENLTIIEKYKKLGIIKEFKTEEYRVEKYLFH